MIKKTIILSLLGSTLLLTGCSNTHQIDDIPNYDTSSFKTATVIYPHRNQDIFRDIGSHYYHVSSHSERNHFRKSRITIKY